MSARRTVRAYIGLGRERRRPGGDARRRRHRARHAARSDRSRRVAAVRDGALGVADQPEFRNAVVALDVPLAATTRDRAPCAARLAQEARAGVRPPTPTSWGPRELDLDLLVFGRHRISVDRPPAARSIDADIDPAKAAKRLEVPHRDLGERLFVLAPFADVAPAPRAAGWHETVEHAPPASRGDRAAWRRPRRRVVGPGAPRRGRGGASPGAGSAGPPCRRPR